MPQIFQVLRCYQCSVFQVHQTKKCNKFGCKLCGAKQSIKRQYGIGTAKDCRLHVQKLNGIRKEVDNASSTISESPSEDEETDTVEIPQFKKLQKSKWNNYVENITEPEPVADDPIYLAGKEVVLEVPKKRARVQNIQLKVLHTKVDVSDSIENNCPTNSSLVDIAKHIDYLGQCSSNNGLDFNREDEDNRFREINSSIEKENFTPREKSAYLTKQCFPKNLNTVNMSSKWAQFVEDEEILIDHGSVDSDDAPLSKNSSLSDSKEKQVTSHTLFSLTEDNDLDNILSI